MKIWHKTIAAISTFALLLNSLAAPLTVLAQEAAPTPEPTAIPEASPTDASTPTPEATIEATATPEVTPDATPAEIVTPTPEVAPEATDLVTPAPSDQPVATQAPESNPTVQGPPENSSSQSPSTTPTATPSFTPESQPENATVTTTVVITSVFPSTVQNGLFKLITDKLDYSPTEVAIITGSNFTTNKTYSLAVSSTNDPATSTTVDVTTDGNGSFTYNYQLDGNFRPNYKVEVKDQSGKVVATTTFMDTFVPPNTPPVAVNDSYSTNEETALTITAPGVLSNDTDAEGNTLNAVKITDPGHGTVVLNSNGSFTYTPSALFFGTDWFTYKANDGTVNSNTAATVYITVNYVNHPPVAVDDAVSTNQDTPISIDVRANDIDPDPNLITIKSVGYPSYGSASIDVINWKVIYTPPTNFVGTDTFQYTIHDGYVESNRATVTVTVLPTTGTITLDKITNPSGDPTLFNLKINNSDQAGGYTPFGTYQLADTTQPQVITVPTGWYGVDEIAPTAGWIRGSTDCVKTGGGDQMYYNFYVGSGENVNCSFTNTQTGSISGHKINDKNHNAIFDAGDEYLSGWTIFIDGNSNQLLDPGEPNVQTNANGEYRFDSLPLGDYRVCEQMQNNWKGSFKTCYAITLTSASPGAANYNFYNYTFGYLRITKDLVPDQSGWYDLGYDNVSITTNHDDYDSTPFEIPSGPHTVWERGANGTNLSDFQVVFSGDCDSQGYVLVGVGESKVCHITNTKLGSITAHKFISDNRDPVQDPGEANKEGWWMDLYPGENCSNARQYGGSTNVDGNVTFDNLPYGKYSVMEESRLGWENENNLCQNVTLNSETETVSFGNFEYGKIQGQKYEDLNNNGSRDDGEPYLQGWNIRLYNGLSDGSWSTSYVEHPTNINGLYGFEYLSTGTYFLCEAMQTGWTQNEPSGPNTVVNQSVNASQEGARCYRTVISRSGDLFTDNFGNVQLGSISGMKFNDLEGDVLGPNEGDTGDPGIPGWTIELYRDNDSNWQFVTSVQTDSNGVFLFSNLEPGINYKVAEEMRSGWTPLMPNGQGYYTVSPLQPGQNITKMDFGNAQLSDIHGIKWNDENGNGVRDCLLGEGILPTCIPTEPLLGGWTIKLYKWDGDFNDWGLEGTDVTDNIGWYVFENLLPGDYRVCEEQQGGWDQTYPINETNNCHQFSLPNNNRQTVNEITGAEYDFGNQQSNPEISIDKTPDTQDASAGQTVTFTLKISNNGNTTVNNLNITDLLPGGFSYVTGSTTGDFTGDPSVSGGTLTWNTGLSLAPGNSLTISYKTTVALDLTDGTYTNFSDCNASYSERMSVSCDLSDSATVKISHGISYGGSLGGQVLGISTELPGTGSPTALIFIGLGLITAGFVIKRKYVKN